MKHGFTYSSLIAEKVITVTFIFLGQVGDSSGRTYRKGNVFMMYDVVIPELNSSVG